MEQEVEKEKQDRYAIQSVEKTLDVIEALAEHDSLSLIELAQLVKQPKSSLYRIILTLEKRGFISRSEGDGKYCLGYKQLILTKSLLQRSSLRTAALAEMNALATRYGDTVNLCVLSNGDVVYVEIIEGSYALRMSDTVGSKAPFHATATGKTLAAFLPEEEREQLIGSKELIAYTPHTITAAGELGSELAKIRADGYAVDREEIVLGARCVAAPIYNMFGRVEGAVSMSGAKHRFPDDQLPAIAADVIAAARDISRKMGFVSEA